MPTAKPLPPCPVCGAQSVWELLCPSDGSIGAPLPDSLFRIWIRNEELRVAYANYLKWEADHADR